MKLIDLIFFTFSIIMALVLGSMGFKLWAMVLLGLPLGLILQRSRFCIASAYTDLILFRDGALFRALILFVLVSTLGFAAMELRGEVGYVVPLGWRTILGGVLFGCGMVLAGGCAAGSLMRLGEGYVLFIPALIGLIIGSSLGAYHYQYWVNRRSLSWIIFLPDLVGVAGAVLIQTVILGLIWLAVKRWECR